MTDINLSEKTKLITGARRNRAWCCVYLPWGRRDSPESVADVFLFMCSSMANELTGQVVGVDMGVSIPKIG
jgi:enoyl-[acyl-carrier-protein] reductase (NADH)